MKRSSTIDVIKGICIIFIVITHFEWTSEQRLQYLFPFWIDMAVPMFMIITGYLYTKSNCSKNVYSFKENYSLEIIGSKLIRYTIPFTIAYVIQLSIWILKNKDMTVGAVIKDFIRGGAGPGSYYYPILVQLVFIFPIIFYIVKEYNTKGLCICGFMNIAYEVLQSTYGMTENLYRLLIFRYIFLVAFGVYISQNKINKKAGGGFATCDSFRCRNRKYNLLLLLWYKFKNIHILDKNINDTLFLYIANSDSVHFKMESPL